MFNGDAAVLVTEHLPDDLRALRDTIARTEAERPGHVWERHRDAFDLIKRFRSRCETTGHCLVIALNGRPGSLCKLMRNRRDERRTCIMCGTEEVGKPVTGLVRRILFGRVKWKFETLNGRTTRRFADPEWYFETVAIFRQFSFPTDVVLHHAFPPRIPRSIASHQRKS